MKSFFILLTSLCMSLFSFGAITGYSRGYVVTNNNDTIYGLLQFGGNKLNTENCILKDSVTHQEKQYTPADILAYRFSDGKYYVSKLLIDSVQSKKVFMEFLVKGIVDIFYFPGNDNGRYFLDKGDGKLVELKNTRYLTEQEEKKYYRYRNEYVTELSQVFQDSPKTCEELMHSELDYKSLTNLVVAYHKDRCTSGDCVVYKKQLAKEKIHGGILLGANYVGMTKGTSDDIELFRNSSPNNIVYPSVGMFFEVRFPYINNDLIYARYEPTLFYEVHRVSNALKTDAGTTSYAVKDKKLNIRNSIFCRCELSRSKCRPFLDLGFFFKTALWSKADIEKRIQYNGSSNVHTVFVSEASRFLKLEVGPVAGFGLKFKVNNRDFYTSLRYSFGTGLVSDDHFRENIFSFNVGLQLF